MYLGYNTNGLAHHHPLDAIALLAELGYQGVGLTIDHALLSPFSDDWQCDADEIFAALARYELRSVIETGARYLLDPRIKHEPTLMSPDLGRRMIRVEFLLWCIDIAAELGSDAVSFWSGIVRDQPSEPQAFARLVESLKPILHHAAERNVTLAFEPEPGMFIDTMGRYEQLLSQLNAPHFKLTLDLGHLHCQGETPIADYLRRFAPHLANIHIEDMRRGVHEHLMFGEGEMEFPPIFAALREIDYQGGVYVELSRHSHEGPEAASRAMKFLRPLAQCE
jgi:sugar phosphate isomerase/epimerase